MIPPDKRAERGTLSTSTLSQSLSWRNTGATVYTVEAVVFCVGGLAWQFARQSLFSAPALLDSVLISMLFASALLSLVLTTFLDAPSIHASHYQLCLTLFLFYLYVLLDDAAAPTARYACPLFGNMPIYQAAGGLTLAFLAVLTLCAAAAARDRLWRSPAWAIGLLVLTTGLHASVKRQLDPSSTLPGAIYSIIALLVATSYLAAVLDPRLQLVVPSIAMAFGRFIPLWIKGISAVLGVIAAVMSMFAVDRATWVQMTFLPVAEVFLIMSYFFLPDPQTPSRPIRADPETPGHASAAPIAPQSSFPHQTPPASMHMTPHAVTRGRMLMHPAVSPEDMLFGRLALISHPHAPAKKNI